TRHSAVYQQAELALQNSKCPILAAAPARSLLATLGARPVGSRNRSSPALWSASNRGNTVADWIQQQQQHQLGPSHFPEKPILHPRVGLSAARGCSQLLLVPSRQPLQSQTLWLAALRHLYHSVVPD